MQGAIPEQGVTTLVTHLSCTMKLQTGKRNDFYFFFSHNITAMGNLKHNSFPVSDNRIRIAFINFYRVLLQYF